MSHFVDETAQSILAQLQKKKSPVGSLLLPAGILVLALLCGVLSWNMPFQQNIWSGRTEKYDIVAPKVVPLPATPGSSSAVIIVRTGMNEQDDLFLCESDPITECVNLTQSPAVQETWPVLNTSGDTVAYYGVADTTTELYLLSLPNGIGTPITVRAGQSGLHTDYEIAPVLPVAFSPDGQWLAFPARSISDDVVVMFIAETKGQAVLRVNNWVGNVVDYRWIDNETLIVALTYSGHKQDYRKVHYYSGAFSLGEIP